MPNEQKIEFDPEEVKRWREIVRRAGEKARAKHKRQMYEDWCKKRCKDGGWKPSYNDWLDAMKTLGKN